MGAAVSYGDRTRRSASLLQGLEALDLDRLKTRALEVVVCAREGDSNDEIAQYLGISVSTVKRCLASAARGRPDAGLRRPAASAWAKA